MKNFKADFAKIHLQIIEGLRDYFGIAGFKRAVVGLSGGIDSSLTLKLAVDALGSENVTGLIMPELGLSSRENIEHATRLASIYGVTTFKVPINRFLNEYATLPWIEKIDELQSDQLRKQVETANANTKSRIRANILYHFANSIGALVLGTSNKSETRLGYGTKYGDLAADIEVIGDLYKTEVRAMAAFLDIPREIIDKAPTAELFSGQTDAEELGADYSVLDTILVLEDKIDESGIDPNLIKNVHMREKQNLHKTVMPYIIQVDAF
jgi:NAD+ synthase